MPRTSLFEIERQGETIISTPLANLSSFDDVESNAGEVVDALSDLSIKNLVLDFRKTDYFGCSALALFVKLRRIVKGHNGSMAFCNLSEHEREILHVTRLDTLWPTCATRAAAMKTVANRIVFILPQDVRNLVNADRESLFVTFGFSHGLQAACFLYGGRAMNDDLMPWPWSDEWTDIGGEG